MNYVERIAVTSQEERKNAILSVLDELGLPYEIHDTVWNEKPVSNFIVSLNPSDHRLVIGSHWDSVAGSTGANDNASSCSILLRLCEHLRDTEKSVDFVFFDQEEAGCLGSKAYIEKTGAEKIAAMVNLDVCGHGRHIVISGNGNVENSAFYGIMLSANLEKNGVNVLDWLPHGDDRSFAAAQIPNISVCTLETGDLEVFKRISQKFGAGQSLSEEESQAFHNVEVLKTMHNGVNDSISAVNPMAMDAVFAFIAGGL